MSLVASASAHSGAGVEGEARLAITVRAIHGATAFLALEAEWRGLVSAMNCNNPFLAWEWVSTWARHFWDGTLLTLVVAEAGNPVAILPFTLQRHSLLPGLSWKTARLYGPTFFVHMFEMTEPLINERHVDEVNAAAFEFLFREADLAWVEMSACTLRPGWQPPANLGFCTLRLGQPIPLPVMSLAESWPQQVERLGRHVRRKIKHPLNTYSKEGRAVVMRKSTVKDLEESVQTFLRLHRERSRSRRGPTHFDYFRSARLREFLREVAGKMGDAGQCTVTSIEVDGNPVTARLNYEMGDTLYLSFSGFDPAAWSYSPMTLLLAQTIEDALERGKRWVNFSPGFDPAKGLWPVEFAVLRRAILVRGGRRTALLLMAFEAFRRLCAGLRHLLARLHVPPLHMLWRTEAPGW